MACKITTKLVDFGDIQERVTIHRILLPKQYNVYDLLDNLIGSASSIEIANSLFKERYKYWEGDCSLFIDESTIPLREPIEPIKSLSYIDYLI